MVGIVTAILDDVLTKFGYVIGTYYYNKTQYKCTTVLEYCNFSTLQYLTYITILTAVCYMVMIAMVNMLKNKT